MDNNQVVQLWNAGQSLRQIAHVLGVTKDRARWRIRDLQEAGRIERRRPGSYGLWTAERAEHLRKRFNEGAGASLIAVELGTGFTRNMVAGKIWRLRLKREPGMKCVQAPRAQLAPHRPTRPHVHQPPVHIELPAENSANPVALADLRRCHCRWPLPTGLYCGDAVRIGTSWCHRHYGMVFRGR